MGKGIENMFSSHIKMFLDFAQAIAWPAVTFLIFFYFAPILKKILLSVNKAVSQRGIKLTKSGVEIPGPHQQEAIESVRDLFSHQRDWGELAKQSKTEWVHEPLMIQSETKEPVLEHHEKNLVGDIQTSLQGFLREKTSENYPRGELIEDLLCDAYISLYFERCFQRILGSQLDFLHHLLTAQDHKLPQREASQIFYDHYPNLSFESYQKWLHFLERLQFVYITDSLVGMTKEGKEFLRYIEDRGYSMHKPG